ncbi:NFX1-type zinc finger-containing protein 1, partial [Aaosphaeria arxii CBS 175.79]
HDTGFTQSGQGRRTVVEQSEEQREARNAYTSWKRQIRDPPYSRYSSVLSQTWTDAVAILNNDDDREWKQVLPRDLDSDELCGREHIQALMNVKAPSGEFGCYIKACSAFLQVFTHTALLHCLSVDTYVGALYNYIGGPQGKRAIPFFERLCLALVSHHNEGSGSSDSLIMEDALVNMSTALHELLRREPRIRFNDDLPGLIDSIERTAASLLGSQPSFAYQIVTTQVKQLRALVAHAGQLVESEETDDLSFPIGTSSTYPRDIVLPRDRHDNDKIDMTKISIFPTMGEILSDAVEFLPSTDRDQTHFQPDPIARHFDTLFRLFRHDTFGELKEALGNLIKAAQDDPSALRNPKHALGDIRARHYNSAHIAHVAFSRNHGLEVHFQFQLPSAVRSKKAVEKQNLKYPQDDNHATVVTKLVAQDEACLKTMIELSCQRNKGVLIEFSSVLPATFVPILENLQGMQRTGRLPFHQWILPDKVANPKETLLDIPPPLYARKPGFSFPMEAIKVSGARSVKVPSSASPDDTVLIDSLEDCTSLDRGQRVALIAALTREFAFIQGPPGTGKTYLGVQLMRVLLSIKDLADLGPIVVVCYTNHALDQFLEHLIKVGIVKVIRMGGQSHSTLLEEHNLRSISKGEERTRQEGWQLASSYEKLERNEEDINKFLGRVHSLHKRSSWKDFEHSLRRAYPLVYRQFNAVDEEGFKKVGRHPFDIWKSSGAHTPEEGEVADDDIGKPDMDRIMWRANKSVNDLSRLERTALIEHWCARINADTFNELFGLIEEANNTTAGKQKIYDEVDRRVLQGADVVGITTTGLAKRIAMLQRLRCKVVICEEAGEVMEPHMISTLLPTVEHFIQIGDHEQLRPTINHHKLSLESRQGALYQLDRSQFERLSVGERGRPKLPVAQLDVQRRMRPEISTLVRETIYPKLVDHHTTTKLPDVVGMRKNVFWLDHQNLEESKDTESHHEKSKSNLWEVEMVHSLVRHIVRQGAYKSDEIAVLTPYTGQLQKLRAAMRQDFEIVLSDRDEDALAQDGFNTGDTSSDAEAAEQAPDKNKRKPLAKKQLSDLLRVATVDNFQGEEAKIIIVSLVRSNTARKVGFLKTTNRINVLLSRAQHGLYLIGNTDTYSNVPMWKTVIEMLQSKESVGEAFGLCCPRHPETEIEVALPEDFAKYSPEGGCRLACDRRLSDCGHRCEARCHSQSMHDVFACPKPCERLLPRCGHPCQKQTCGEDCGRCLIQIDDVKLPCGHCKDRVECYRTEDVGLIRCTVNVRKVVPGCKHKITVPCFRDVTSELYQCPTPCSKLLSCGHPCSGTCGECITRPQNGGQIEEHQTCQKICGRRFGTCNHTCPRPCHDGKECGPCVSPCEVQCAHSKCTLKCHEACAPCVEPCAWSCEHQGVCTLPCSAPCNRLPCDERCTKLLSCGHQCPGICGEICHEDYCHDCKKRYDDRVDMLEFKTYAEIDVTSTPIVVLGCGHFFTAETLDGMMGMSEVYGMDSSGSMIGLKDISGSLAPSVPKCPNCNLPVRQYATQRFNRVINRAVIDEMSRRFLASGQMRLTRLGQEVKELEEKLTRTQSAFLHPPLNSQIVNGGHEKVTVISKKQLKDRYNRAMELSILIKRFQKEFADRHQPAQKLHQATLHAIRRNASLEDAFANLGVSDTTPVPERDRRIALGAQILYIKIECVSIEDKLSVFVAPGLENTDDSSTPESWAVKLTKPFLKNCNGFIDSCTKESLPQLAVQAIIFFSRVVFSFHSMRILGTESRAMAKQFVEQAKELLQNAIELCQQPFRDAEQLKVAVEHSLELLGREWYEEVTAEELQAIKDAMVSGGRGISTHSGHWYNCVNGHPFAIGECGMPMQLARCPECGAPIGGQNHTAVDGVSRATDMEN